MEQSSTIPEADATGMEADVSAALSRMGSSLGADLILFLRWGIGATEPVVINGWVSPDDFGQVPERGTAKPGLVEAISSLAESGERSVIEIHGESAESIRGRCGDSAVVGRVTGSADLAVALVFAGKVPMPDRVMAATAQFCDLVGQITRRADAELLLDRRLQLEMALNDASAGLVDIGPEAMSREIERHLGRLGVLFEALVATVWDDDKDGSVHRTHIWVDPSKESLADYPIDVIPVGHPISTTVRSLGRAGIVDFANHFDSDEPRVGQSLVAAPLTADGEVVGAVTFAFDGSAGSPADSDFWCTVATGFATLISHARRRARAELGEVRAAHVEAAVGGIARMLVEASSSSFAAATERVMRSLGELVGACCVQYYNVEAGDVDLVSSWCTHPNRDCHRIDCHGPCGCGAGLCQACGRIAVPIEAEGRVAGKIACDMGSDRSDDPVVQGIMEAVGALIAQYRRRCHAELGLAARREADAVLRDLAAKLIGPDSTADAALDLLKTGLGASHVSLWSEHVAWRSDSHCHARCLARAGEAQGRDHIAVPRSLLQAISRSGDVLDYPIHDVPRWLEAVTGGGLKPGPRCISIATSPIGAEEAAILFVLSDGVGPADEPRRHMILRSVELLAQNRAQVVAEETFVASFKSAPVAIAIRSVDGRLLSCNDAYVEFAGWPRDELIGGRLEELLAEPGTIGEISADGRYADIPYRRPSGDVVWGRARFSHVQLAGSPDPVLLSHIEDVTEARRVSQILAHRATHDPLTDLPNRNRFFELLDEGRNPSGGAVIVVDLDKFADINDTFGHHAGDSALITCADRLRLALRPGDSICRLGGDEFAIHLPGDVSEQEVAAVAARLLSLMREPIRLDDYEIRVTLSIGSAIGDSSSTVQDLIRCADAAMYKAKQGGRDRYVVFDNDLLEELADHLKIESQLRDGLREGRFEVHYQPEVNLDNGRVVGTEALLRWNHPERGELAAGAFIEVAEHSGLIVELGRWVLEEAARQAAAWRQLGHDLVMRVNLSTRQLRPAVVDEVRHALSAAGLRPDHLCLEVTETAIMDDVGEAMRLLREISDIGVKLAIDDFGTGYSSLAYLKRIPVDILKIDKTFVDGVGIDGQDTGIVDTVIRLGRALDLDVVAEGIENARQIDDLRQLGCWRGQGFYLARPAPAANIEEILAETSRR